MRTVVFGDVEVARFVIGGNPFSGFSHQSRERSQEMVHYYTVARIKEALRKAEEAGINTFFGRTDRHVKRMLLEYWDEAVFDALDGAVSGHSLKHLAAAMATFMVLRMLATAAERIADGPSPESGLAERAG